MTPVRKIALVFFCTVLCVLFSGGHLLAAAADSGSNWRGTYDLVLRWVNFLILAGVIVKFARTPLKDFLNKQKEKQVSEIRKKEKEKETAADEVKEMVAALNESETRFIDLKERIVEQGKKKKVQIVEDAKDQSRQMLRETQRRVETQIYQAKEDLKAELIDTAVGVALEQLPKEITPEDNEKFLDQFLSNANSSA